MAPKTPKAPKASKAGKPPKSAKTGAGKGQKSDEKQDDVLKAVVIADSFQDRFLPFTIEKPRCLLPLVNTPLIEHTLEYLAASGVQEVYIYAKAHKDEIQAHIEQHAQYGLEPDTSLYNQPFQVLEFIPVADASSIGDFMRDLDKRGKVTSDFLLVHADLVSNVPIRDMLAIHRARREENRDAIMTMVLRCSGNYAHRTASQAVQPLFFVEPSGRVLGYEENTHIGQHSHLLMDTDMILSHPEFEIRGDCIDPGLDICTPEVLALWAESFDYELPRKHFLHGVLKDWELNGKMIYAKILDKGYAARAINLQVYNGMSRDIMGRWALPNYPENNLHVGEKYKRQKNDVAAEEDVVKTTTTKWEEAVIGRQTSFGTKTSVYKSVVGRRCKIGKNVVIRDSYIWDDVVVADGTTIESSILANNVVVGKDCTISEGCLVSFGVEIGDGVKLAKDTRLSTVDCHGKPVTPDTALLGTNGKAAIFREDVEDEDGDDDVVKLEALQKTLVYRYPKNRPHSNSVSEFGGSEGDMSDDEGDNGYEVAAEVENETPRSRLDSFASEEGDSRSFHDDALHGVLETLRATNSSDADFDSAKLEFMGLRLANNASDASMRRAIAVAFAQRAGELHLEGMELSKAAQATIGRKGADKFLSEVGVAGDETKDQVEFIMALQKAVKGVKGLDAPKAGSLLAGLLQQMYNADVLEEDGIVAWWEGSEGQQGEMAVIRGRAQVLVDWLQADDEDSDDDEEDDSDEA